MKSPNLPFCFRSIVVALLLNAFGSKSTSAADFSDALTIFRLNQTVFLSWFGDVDTAYQLESSPDLVTWFSLGPVTVGTGNFINVSQPLGPGRAFFRLRRLSVYGSFDPGTGILTITGDDSDNTIAVTRDAAGNIRINNGTVIISGGAPTVANTTLIRIFGRNGNDQLSLDDSNGPLPNGELFGQGDNDTLMGGAGPDVLRGGPGNDILFGRGGDDSAFGEDDNDRMVWNPGDGTDINEGGSGTDTVEVNGGGGDEQFTTTANGARVRFDRLNPAPFSLDIGTSENLLVNANGGNDSFSATGNLAALISITVDGGPGNDTLLGSNGVDVLIGGDDNDFIDGQQGNDVAFLGDGNDTFQWDPGDGSDTVEGQDGNDTLLFNGSAGAEIFEASANGQRVRFTRNLGNIVMDLDDVENLDLNALAGIDLVTVNDLTGTDLANIVTDLAAFGGAGDAAADVVVINGTPGDDIITAVLVGGDVVITGLAATVTVDGFETNLDAIRIQGLGGDDILDASAVSGGPPFILDGGVGNDVLLGSTAADTLLGGDNDDVLLGNGGIDTLDGGTGDNVVLQDGGNVSSGIVTLFGDDLDNTITISRDLAGNLFSNGTPIAGATVANTFLIRVFGKGGNDTITLNETNGFLPAAMLFGGSGNDVLTGGLGADLLFGGVNNDTLLGRGGSDFLFGGPDADTLTGGDAEDFVFGGGSSDRMIWNPGDDTDLNEGGSGTDTVEVNGGGGDEQFTTTANGTRVRFDRLNPAPFSLDIGTSENLVLNANGGNDSFSATGNLAALISITVDGGAGDDTLLGSNGADLLIGGDNNDFIDGQQGNDTVFGGAGNDVFQWDPGDGSDTVEGQDGNDTLVFNGSAGAELFNASANGGRVVFTRNLGNIVMDVDDVETLQLHLLGGTDTLTIGNLTGTDLTSITARLAGTLGGTTGDGAADNIIINGTDSDDVITATLPNGDLLVTGLHASILVDAFEPTLDTVLFNGLSGDDIIDASAVPSTGPLLAYDGGFGNDIILGGAVADRLDGGEGDDVLVGNGGVDVFDDDTGNDTLINDGPNIITGVVTLFGDGLDNTLVVSRNAAGAIFLNGAPVPGATVANTSLIRVFGLAGNDTISLDESAGALPAAMLFGGAGNDTLTGGSATDSLFGGANNDTLLGRGGSDFLFGGANNDTLTGGDADDFVFGEGDADRMVWNPGDDTDLNEGGPGEDTVEVNGGGGAEVFTATANGARVRFDRLDPAPFSLDIGTSENLLVKANGGNDSFSATGNLAALIKITVDGGTGDDTLLGSNGADVLIGGDNNDFIDGQQGNDAVFGGAGNDTFQWDPGDGSDTVEGQDGNDTLLFNGSAGAEIFEASADGQRVRFTRNLGNIVMDLDDVENLTVDTLGGIDALIVNNLAGTDLTQVNANLAGTLGGNTGDGAVDTITVNGTDLADVVNVVVNLGAIEILGLPAMVRITTPELANDDLIVNGLGGADTLIVAPSATNLIDVTTNQ